MTIVDQSHKILTSEDQFQGITRRIERIARTCYQSEDKAGPGTDKDLCRKLMKRKHEAMLEHESITVRFITNRGVTHELVRHRLASFAQESTRYVKYNSIEFIRPVFAWADDRYLNLQAGALDEGEGVYKVRAWKAACKYSEKYYQKLIRKGCPPQEAREVLPNSLKTEIVVTANIREWRVIFNLRIDSAAHPQIRALMIPLLKELQEKVPVLFEDIGV